MSSQQFPRSGMPTQTNPGGNLGPGVLGSNQSAGAGEEIGRDTDHRGPQGPPPGTGGGGGGGGALPFREDKQDTVVVRPYPQVQAQTHSLQPQGPALPHQMSIQGGSPGQPVAVSNTPVHILQGQPAMLTDGQIKAASKSPMPSRLIAPAPASGQTQGLLPLPAKVPTALAGHITVTLDSSIGPTSSIPVATISGHQGHSSNLHHLVPANIQIIRAPAVSQHAFPSHVPRGAAAAAVMSSSKGPTVLRPASGASAGLGQPPGVPHILHQPIQSRPPITTSTAVPPTVVASVSANRTPAPVINPTVTHSAEKIHGCPALTIHAPPATISIQRPQGGRDTATRINLPHHPAIGGQKLQQPHTLTQKSIFSSVTPVAAATVAPILASNTVPSITTTGAAPHTQMSSNTIVTMTSHPSHPTAVTNSTIPVAKVVPQPIAHTSPRVQSDYPGDRTNLVSISGHRSSPNPVAIETRSDNRPPVPVQFQYYLPTYSPSQYPLTHTYTPISSSVSTIRGYSGTAQAPSSTLPSQPSVGVATTVHLNPMLMAVDRIGIQSAQISTQGIQPQPIGAQGIQPAPIGVQGLHGSGPINTQGIQQAPVTGQPQTEAKPTGLLLADGSTFVTGPIGTPYGTTQPVVTMVQTHPQGTVGGGAPTLASSPRPSILRKKPANEGCVVRKSLIPAGPVEASGRVDAGVRSSVSPRPAGVKPKTEAHVSAVALPVQATATVEALSSRGGEEQQVVSSPAQQHMSQAIPSTLLASSGPPQTSQPGLTVHLSALPASLAVAGLPVPASTANTVASPTQPAASSTVACSGGSAHKDVKIKLEAEPMETSQPVPQPLAGPALSGPHHQSLQAGQSLGDLVPGASPRKKPRKQQHVISTEETEMVEANSTDEDRAPGHRTLGSRAEKRPSPSREYVDEEGVRYVPVKPRPPVTLLRHYRNPWKAAYHHFQRYSDIRVKEEKGSLQDMANQRGVACRAQGWKIHLCAAQLMQLSNLEHDVYSRLTSLQEGLMPKKRAGADDELHRISELIQGNMQRCKLVMDQVTEARETMLKVLDHKDKVLKLLNKTGPVKKSNKLKRKDRA
ncbi:hypothetical protein DPEC_G00271940 [Dallia pectoralis]|uniref:Uncharacterized protein n=1 Tax=Dallia pectoralis TaxID=75939 RepID=A0ACC2FQ29_DALPE|nr:hypothetical protein DPEC_G00271940 [Dallia pectoralis]